MTFFKEIKARWRSKMPLFWAKVNRVALWLSGLQAVFLPILMDDSISQHLHPYLIEALKGGLTISVTAALLSKLTTPNAAQLEENKDSGVKSKMINRGKGAAMLLLLLTLPSCVTYQKCVDKFGAVYKDTLKVPIKRIIPKDSANLRYEIRRIPLNIPIIAQSENGAKITLTKTEEGGEEVIEAQADCPEKIIVDTLKVPYEKTVFQCPEKKPWQVWQNWALLGLAVLLIWAVVRR